MRLVLPLGLALLVGLAAIVLVGIAQTWAAVAVAGVVIVATALTAVIAVGRVVDERPRGGAAPRPARPARP